MKTLKYFFLLAIVFAAFSCSNDEMAIDQKEIQEIQKEFEIFDKNESVSFNISKSSDSWNINKEEAIKYLMVVFEINNAEDISEFEFYYNEPLGIGSISVLHSRASSYRSVGINFNTTSSLSGPGNETHECDGGSCSSCQLDRNWWGKIVGCECLGNGNCIHKVTTTY